MILFIVAASAIVLGLVLIGVRALLENRGGWMSDYEWLSDIAAPMIAIGLVAVMVTGGIALVVNANSDLDCAAMLDQRATLIYRIENSENVVTGNDDLFNEIVSFNDRLRRAKTRGKSPWLNWYYNQQIIDTVDCIDLSYLSESGGN